MMNLIGRREMDLFHEAVDNMISYRHVEACKGFVHPEQAVRELTKTYADAFRGAEIDVTTKPRNLAWLDVRLLVGRQRTPLGAMPFAAAHQSSVVQNAVAIALDLFPMVAGSLAVPTRGAPRAGRHPDGHWRWSQLLHPLVVQDIARRNDSVAARDDRMDMHLEQNTLELVFPGMDGGEDGFMLFAQGVPAFAGAERLGARLAIGSLDAKDLAEPGRLLADVVKIERCGVPHVDAAVDALVIETVQMGDYGLEAVLAPTHHVGLDPYPTEAVATLMRAVSGRR